MSDSTEIWWWTLRQFGSRCDNCEEPIPARTAFAYRHATQEGLCPVCVDTQGIVAQRSNRLERHQQATAASRSPLTGKSRSQKAARRDAVTEALRLGPATTQQVATRTGLPVILAGAALGRLQATGNVVRDPHGTRRWELVENRGTDQPALGDGSSAASPAEIQSPLRESGRTLGSFRTDLTNTRGSN